MVFKSQRMQIDGIKITIEEVTKIAFIVFEIYASRNSVFNCAMMKTPLFPIL